MYTLQQDFRPVLQSSAPHTNPHRGKSGKGGGGSFSFICSTFGTRETREGWPLLTIETEVNGDSKRTNERGSFLAGSFGMSCRYKRFLFCLGCPGQPSTKYFFLTVHYIFQFLLSTSPSKRGRQPCWVAGVCASVWGILKPQTRQ